jgi:hypothetical protein
MFWGCVLKEGQTYKVSEVLKDREFPVLHLSSVALSKDAKDGEGKTFLTVNLKHDRKDQEKHDLKNLTIAVLEPKRHDQQSVDLYFNIQQNVTISCHGKGTLHVSGYFESGG